ncbi:MAG: NADP-dependent oxidoreductase [Methylotenera sp.]|nr:NADP-dependent oxidoreductase [Oligoflexia bacterium]
MSIKAERFVLLKRPTGVPDESAFALEQVTIFTELKQNELLLHGLYYSVDPYMRGRMSGAKSYVAPFALNQPMEGSVIARVAASNSSAFRPGDLVLGQLAWATEMVVKAESVSKIDTTDALASEHLGILGMTGLTAYFGLLKIGQPKAGETVVISGAAGAVGTVVGQIAKIKGCKAIGIVGSDEKSKLIKDRFGFDASINYKTQKDLASQIKLACPDGVDVYYDNVGGDISDAVMQNMNFKSRIVLCGQISLYNAKEVPVGPRIQPLLLTRSILMQGFIVTNFQSQFPEAIADLSKWLRDEKIESSETVLEGFENLPKALIGLFSGKNTGKMIVKAAA